MHILLTGGTGLIGAELCALWRTQGHQLSVWSRRPETVAKMCGPGVRGVGRLEELNDQPIDAVINLAGAPIADRPWSKKRKALIWESRIGLTEDLLAWLASREQRPSVLISGSAVGYYGDGREREIDEAAPIIHSDFASDLCVGWEAAALEAEKLGIRVVLLRTGLVIAGHGSFLQRLLLPFKLGLGGPMGSGKQWMPWIHIKDQIALMDFLLRYEGACGPYNACAPAPARNLDFARTLASVLHRPAVLPIPGFALKLGLGELSVMLLGGQQAIPKRLLEAGFTFEYTDLRLALMNILAKRETR